MRYNIGDKFYFRVDKFLNIDITYYIIDICYGRVQYGKSLNLINGEESIEYFNESITIGDIIFIDNVINDYECDEFEL